MGRSQLSFHDKRKRKRVYMKQKFRKKKVFETALMCSKIQELPLEIFNFSEKILHDEQIAIECYITFHFLKRITFHTVFLFWFWHEHELRQPKCALFNTAGRKRLNSEFHKFSNIPFFSLGLRTFCPRSWNDYIMSLIEPRQANLCLRAFRHDKL